MTRAITQTYNVVNENITRLTYTFFVACLLLVSLYIVNLFSVISRTVALQNVESQLSSLGSSVDNLDTQYLSLSGKITPDNLSSYGMSQGQVGEYITRSSGSRLGFTGDFSHVALVAHEF